MQDAYFPGTVEKMFSHEVFHNTLELRSSPFILLNYVIMYRTPPPPLRIILWILSSNWQLLLFHQRPRSSELGLRPPGFESCGWRAVSLHSSHHPQEVLLAQFSLYVHKGGLKPIHSFLFYQNSAKAAIYLSLIFLIYGMAFTSFYPSRWL